MSLLPSSASTVNEAPLTLSGLPRAIVHADCDAFFASVEQALRPELKGRPVITGKERGIASAMSYEAKRRGVVRGMRLSEIKKICPDAILLPSDYETYSLFSKRFHGILRRFTPDVEEYSIDEAFCDISGLRRMHHTSYENIAQKIKDTAERELGITVSVGLSLTKSLAKICSKEKKPSGFTCVKGYELHEFLKKMPTGRVCGFGANTVSLLAKHGITTVLDYIRRPEIFAKKLLGKIGTELWHELRGDLVYPLATSQDKHQASLGKTKTFTPPSSDRDFVKAQALRNLESAFIKLRRHRLSAGTISLYLTEERYRSFGASAELTRPTSATLEAVPVVSKMFDEIFAEGLRYRRAGVVLQDLTANTELQFDFFEDPCRIRAMRKVSEVMDAVNSVYGKHTLHLGVTDAVRRFSQHLGERGDTAARKLNLLKGETFRRRLAIPVWNVKV